MCKIQQQLFCSEIVKRATPILKSGEWTDCKFVLGAEPNRVVVAGYKLIMAFASPVFGAMFFGSLAETRDHIPIVDVEPEIFKAMLRYIYTDNINISSWSEACQIYYAAKKYMLQQLMELCSEYLQTNLNTGNVCQIYEHSLLFEDDALTQKSKKMFSDNTKDLLEDDSFIAADLNTVTTIFSLDELCLDSELDLIEAAARYAKAQDVKSEEETSVSPVESNTVDEVCVDKEPADGPYNLKLDTAEKQYIRSAVRNIRFLTLTPQQYADCAARYSLLTLPEDHAVLMNIASNKSDVPLPSGFSNSKIDRVRMPSCFIALENDSVSETSFLTRINGFHGNNSVLTQAYYFRNLKWQIKLLLHNYNRDYDGLKFALLCTNENQSSSWSCDASVELRIISQSPFVMPLICHIQHVFSQDHGEYTIPQGFSKNGFITNFYLKGTSVEMDVHIKINKLLGIR